MTPIERLEALAKEMELASEPDGPAKGYFAPRLFEPWSTELRAIVAALKQRDDAVRKEADNLHGWRNAWIADSAELGITGTKCVEIAARLRAALEGEKEAT